VSAAFVHWLWIVIDGRRPVAFSGSNQYWRNLHCRNFAQGFSTYGDAYAARQEMRRRYWKLANAAPSLDSPQFKLWMKRADEVRIIRVGVA
jgi:hypothetical protein